MTLNINNFAKIKQAEIIVDGITVIAGENNTGKSTVGKIVFSLFNSISGIEDKILNKRKSEIFGYLVKTIRNHIIQYKNLKNTYDHDAYRLVAKIARQISEKINIQEDLNSEQIYNIIFEILESIFTENKIEGAKELCDSIHLQIMEIINIPGYNIVLELLTRYFNEVFHGQLNSLCNSNDLAILNLNVNKKNIELNFNDNQCTNFKPEILLLHKAIYIDNPFIIDELNYQDEPNDIREHFLKNLLSSTNEDVMDGIFETVLAKEKLHEINQALQLIVKGKISIKDDDFCLEQEEFSQPLFFNNLSTGIKSFIIIKLLIEKALIKEKDVIILDEPEIHLHPSWQIAYAELIVLLQKKFDLSIIVTTHSPYFLDAINLYSQKHEIDKRVNFYLSHMEDKCVEMKNVGSDIDLIYQKMTTPISILETLRYEINN
ncbi:MAG: ATP-binding protein [Lachnospiraceae bacterium]|nr:ATP-binding protein [Lachnospiraceae bacterium]